MLNCVCFKVTSKGRIFGRYPYKKRFSGRMAILANGPSLKEILPEIGVKEEFNNVEFTVMNFFAFDSAFQRIKPRFYCLADPMYIRKIIGMKKLRDYSIIFKQM